MSQMSMVVYKSIFGDIYCLDVEQYLQLTSNMHSSVILTPGGFKYVQ